MTQRRWAALAAALFVLTTVGLTACGDNGSSDPTPSTRSGGSIPGASQQSTPDATENSTPNAVAPPGTGGVP